MPSPARDPGVQSWTFRNFKPIEAMLAQVRAVGASRIELCGAHAAFSDPTAHAPAIAACRAAGVEVCSIGVQTFTDQPQVEKHWFEFARAAGASTISAHVKVDSFHRAIPAARALCEAYDLRLSLHCHGGYMFGGSADVLAHLLDLGGERIGITLDTAWCLQSGNADPAAWVRRFAGRIYGVHYKDFVWDRNGRWSETIPGDGTLDLAGLVKALDETGFAGWTVVEYEATPEQPGPAVAEALRRIRALG